MLSTDARQRALATKRCSGITPNRPPASNFQRFSIPVAGMFIASVLAPQRGLDLLLVNDEPALPSRKDSIVKTEKLLLAATLLLTLLPSMAAAQSGETEVTPLSNKDVLLMVEKKVEAETIIKTIKSSPCTFDTFPPLLKEMKRRGVPEAVLHAMVDAPYGPSVTNSSREDMGEEPIYHYAEQLKQMGYLNPVSTSRGLEPMRARARASRSRSQTY